MKKREIITFTLGIFFILSLMLFLVYSPKYSMSGFATYTNLQPNSTNGEDTYIREGSEANYADSTVLRVGETVAKIEFRTFIKFDLSQIPPGNTILSSILQVYAENSYGEGNRTINVYRVTEGWEEYETTWTKRTNEDYWFTQGGEYDSSKLVDSVVFTNESGKYYNFTLTVPTRNWMNETYNNYGIILVATAENGNYTEISSSNSETEEYRPLLIVEHDTNSKPTSINISSTTHLDNPARVGESINFTVYWQDLEGNPTELFVCNSSEINTSGCTGYEYCKTSSSGSSPHICSYVVQEEKSRITQYWIALCEAGQCSESENSSFYVNHLPYAVEIVQPNGGETINQSADGNYQIKFSLIDKDADNLSANLYYSSSKNVKENLIASINLNSTYCNDIDNNKSTPPNNCWYWWNTTGIYGTYYFVLDLNDSYHNRTNSSAGNFSVISLIDPYAPSLSNVLISYPVTSGKNVSVNATIADDNKITAWIAFNKTIENATMTNISSSLFIGYFEAPQIGTYQYKVFARDLIGNTNDSMEWETFEVIMPNATVQNESSPQIALPFQTIKVTGSINATEELRNVSAYLNVPEGFTFLNNYPQMTCLGDIEDGTIKEAVWYLSTPMSEGMYIMNITFSDKYYNYWNSSNMQIQITSSIGGYEISVDGYPEVETANNYYVETSFKQSGTYSNPDSMHLQLYDASGIAVVGPVEIFEKSTGIYNYTYLVGASATEGQWKTIVNATKNGVSYYGQEFWKVIGGPFDVRNITVVDDTISQLGISFIAENTGGANKDLILSWNLTRVDTSEVLDTGGETRMVPADSELPWTIHPSTDYIGQVRISLLGYYSGTEKAGAYQIFSTKAENQTPPSGGGGGGGGAQEEPIGIVGLDIETEEIIAITKNIPKKTKVYINNTGKRDITLISLVVEGMNKSDYSVSPLEINILSPGNSTYFEVTYLIFEDIGNEKEITYFVSSREINAEKDAKIIVLSLKDYFEREIKNLNKRIGELKIKLSSDGKEKLLDELQICEESLNSLENALDKQDFYKIANEISYTEECINDIDKKMNENENKSKYIKLIIVIVILIILILFIYALITYRIYKRVKIVNFIKKQQESNAPYVAEGEDISEARIEKKFKKIERRLGIRGSKK